VIRQLASRAIKSGMVLVVCWAFGHEPILAGVPTKVCRRCRKVYR